MWLRAEALLCLVSVTLCTAGGQLWYPAKVSTTILSTGNVDEVSLVSKVICAAHASHVTWADLFCFENGVCSIYDVDVGGYHDDSALGDVASCWTKHDCVVDGINYNHGDQFQYNGFPVMCWDNKATALMKGVSSCPPPFFEAVGCFLYVSTQMTWHEARKACLANGADLAVPKDFGVFRQALKDRGLTQFIYVGIQNRFWLDGTTINNWGSGEPNSLAEDVGITLELGGDLYLADISSTYVLDFICQAKIQ